MPLANVTFESVLVFLHVLAVIVAFGPTFAYGILVSTAVATNQAAVPTVISGIRRIDTFLGLPGLAVLVVTGIWLVIDEDRPWDWSDTFVSIGLTAIIILIAMMLLFFRPRSKRAAAIAEQDLAAGTGLSDDFDALSRQLAIGSQLATLIVLVALFFMVVKP